MTKIIAEIGKNFINVEGEQSPEALLDKAKILVDLAKEAGADIVKFQTHVFEDEQHKRSEVRYEWIKRNERGTPYDKFWLPLKEYCDQQKIEFLTTPMSKMAAEKVQDLVKQWKVGSAELTDFSLLTYLASTDKPVILSSGMSDVPQVRQALDVLTSRGADITLMHCVSVYPCPDEWLNLNTIKFWQEELPNFKLGFSDHSLSTLAPAIAVAMGAVVIEKHFTIDRTAFGPDHKVSLIPTEFAEMVQNIRRVEAMLGVNGKILLKEEKEFWKNFRTNV